MLAVVDEISGWPLAVVLCVGIIGFVAMITGSWPGEGIITHNHYHNKEENEDKEEE